MRHTLEQTLQELHEQLTHVEDLGPEQVEMLRSSVAEIKEALDEKDVSAAGLAERLQEATDQLKASHPVLTNTIGRVADLLSQIGI